MATEAPPEAKPFSEIVPKDFQDRAYLKDFLGKPQSPETFTEFFKKFDGAQALIGKKGGIPEEGAPDTEWDSFYSKLRAAKAEDYEVKAAPGQKADPAFAKALQDAFHAGGIDKRQAAKFQDTILPWMAERTKAQADAQAKLDAEFEVLAKTTLGPDNAKVIERVNLALKEHCPATLRPYLDKLDNNNLVIVANVVDAILRKYVPEDQLNGGKGTGTTVTVESLRDQARAIMASKEFTDEFHPEHAKAVQKKDELYRQIAVAKK